MNWLETAKRQGDGKVGHVEFIGLDGWLNMGGEGEGRGQEEGFLTQAVD